MVHAIDPMRRFNATTTPLSSCSPAEALRFAWGQYRKPWWPTAAMSNRPRCNVVGVQCCGSGPYANSPSAAVHPLAYPSRNFPHRPHGLFQCAWWLPHVLALITRQHAGSRLRRRIAADAFPPLAEVEGKVRPAQKPFNQCALRAFGQGSGFPSVCADVDIPQVRIPKMAEDAMVQAAFAGQ